MAYALVGSLGTPVVGASGAAITPTFAQATTKNNLLVLWVIGGGTVNAPAAPDASWTTVLKKSGVSGNSASLFYKVAAGGDANPTVALVASTVLQGGVGEFSGNGTFVPFDQVGSGSGSSTPTTATNAAVDVLAGELLVAIASYKTTANTAVTISHTLATVGSTTNLTNGATSTQSVHYAFAWGITTSKGSADSDSFAFTGGTPSGTAVVLASFALPAVVAPFFVPPIAPQDPASIFRIAPGWFVPGATARAIWAPSRPLTVRAPGGILNAAAQQWFVGPPAAAATTGSATLAFAGTATATVKVTDTGTGALAFAGTATGIIKESETGTASLTFAGSATGSFVIPPHWMVRSDIRVVGPGSILVTVPRWFVPAGLPVNSYPRGAGALAFTGTASATVRETDSAVGTLTFAGTANATVRLVDTATGALTFAGTAAATVRVPATGSGALAFAGTLAPTPPPAPPKASQTAAPFSSGGAYWGLLSERIRVEAASSTLTFAGAAVATVTVTVAARGASTFTLSGQTLSPRVSTSQTSIVRLAVGVAGRGEAVGDSIDDEMMVVLLA